MSSYLRHYGSMRAAYEALGPSEFKRCRETLVLQRNSFMNKQYGLPLFNPATPQKELELNVTAIWERGVPIRVIAERNPVFVANNFERKLYWVDQLMPNHPDPKRKRKVEQQPAEAEEAPKEPPAKKTKAPVAPKPKPAPRKKGGKNSK